MGGPIVPVQQTAKGMGGSSMTYAADAVVWLTLSCEGASAQDIRKQVIDTHPQIGFCTACAPNDCTRVNHGASATAVLPLHV
jgi:hypothetical protein